MSIDPAHKPEPAARSLGPFARRWPRLMVVLVILMAVAAALTLLFSGHAQPILYQGF